MHHREKKHNIINLLTGEYVRDLKPSPSNFAQIGG